MGKFARDKGVRGEQDVNRMLNAAVEQVWAELGNTRPRDRQWQDYFAGPVPVLQRNTLQSDRGGCDITGLGWLALEVKNCATLSLPVWWRQTVEQAKADQVPVLVYKASRGTWRVRMLTALPIKISATTAVATPISAVADIDMETFLVWFSERARWELGNEAWLHTRSAT